MIHRFVQSLIPIEYDYTYVLKELESVGEQVEIVDFQTQDFGTSVNQVLDVVDELTSEVNREKIVTAELGNKVRQLENLLIKVTQINVQIYRHMNTTLNSTLGNEIDELTEILNSSKINA